MSTHPTDAALRAAYDALLAQRATTPGDHAAVSLEDIVALVERRGSEAARLATLDRVMASPWHRAEFDQLMAAHRAVPAPATTWTATSPVWRMAAAAAVVVAVAGGGLWRVQSTRRTDDTVLRSNAQQQLVVRAIGNDSVRITWPHVPGIRTFEIELLDDSSAVVATRTTADTVVQLARTDLRTARQAWVRGTTADGRAWATPVVVLPPR